MHARTTGTTLAAAFGTLFCGLLLTTTTIAQDNVAQSNSIASDMASQQTSALPVVLADRSQKIPQDDGGIAGPGSIVFNNGGIDTGEAVNDCTPTGTRSTLQNTTLCLNTFGINTTNEGTTIFWVADDFTLAACTNLTTIEFLLYETAAPVSSITTMNLRLHRAAPAMASAADPTILQTATGGTSSVITNIYRRGIDATGAALCNRRVQRVTVDVSAWPNLAAGTYWLSWQATGTTTAGTSGPWQPFVTILGQAGKPGANGRQASLVAPATGVFNAVVDQGPPPPCTANIVTTGTSATRVDVDDMLLVISSWGPCPPAPAVCTANVVTTGASATRVDVDDLLFIISNWGACPTAPVCPMGSTPPPIPNPQDFPLIVRGNPC